MTELLRLRLPADPAFATVARESVVSLARGLGFSEDERAALRLAVGEAVNNAAEHAGARTMFTLHCFREESALLIEIDSATLTAPLSTGADMPSGEAEHGRGRALMEALTDSVEYDNSPDRFVVRLRKRLPSS